jgi:DNA-directed RNA polymerase specialized sigma subunit
LRGAGFTYAAIGERLGISGQRVRQIHMRLLTRIRYSLLNE